jgi:hypothetical protein
MREKKFIFVKKAGKYDFRADEVIYHEHLAQPEEVKYRQVDGGGLFEVNTGEKTIKLFGSSGDFGRTRDIETAVKQCLSQIREVIADYIYRRKDIEVDTSDFTVITVNELGEKTLYK